MLAAADFLNNERGESYSNNLIATECCGGNFY
jgi:hypothetical protein